MAIRIQNTNPITFTAALAGAEMITHFRARRAIDDTGSIIVALGTPLGFRAGEDMTIPAGMLRFIYLAGAMGNEHIQVVVESYWGDGGSLPLELDLMTSANAVATDANYSQRVVSDWTLFAESDPA